MASKTITLFLVTLLVLVHYHHQTASAARAQNALIDYVSKPDSNYAWFDTGMRLNGTNQGWTGYMLNMTSQQWLTPQEVSRSIWTHQLLVIVPDEIDDKEHAGIYVTGGSNEHPDMPKVKDEDVLVGAILAMETHTVVGVLWQIPNQHIVFAADPEKKSRSEDELVAFTWNQYIKNPTRPEWIAYFPMVKAVYRALDTIQTFANTQHGTSISKFLVAGASKRGATTWLTGAYSGGVEDGRVVGIVPIVFDMLNFYDNVPHMYEAYDGWTFALQPYIEQNLTTYINTKEMRLLSNQIDPLAYKDSLTMPKLVVDATGDEFFMPDDDYFWWGQLPGETYRLMVQNAEHSMATGVVELLTGARAFYMSLIKNTPRPQFNWTIDETNGDLTMWSSVKPQKVRLWYAETIKSTPNRRDFRLVKGDTKLDPCKFIPIPVFGHACLNPIIWLSSEVEPVVKNNMYYYTQHVEPPANGNWIGFFYEVEYPGPGASDYRLTTQMSIVPRKYPFPPCGTGPACIGGLV